MERELTAKEQRIIWREREMTEYEFMRMELRNPNNYYTPERRRDIEKRVAELRERLKDVYPD